MQTDMKRTVALTHSTAVPDVAEERWEGRIVVLETCGSCYSVTHSMRHMPSNMCQEKMFTYAIFWLLCGALWYSPRSLAPNLAQPLMVIYSFHNSLFSTGCLVNDCLLKRTDTKSPKSVSVLLRNVCTSIAAKLIKGGFIGKSNRNLSKLFAVMFYWNKVR